MNANNTFILFQCSSTCCHKNGSVKVFGRYFIWGQGADWHGNEDTGATIRPFSALSERLVASQRIRYLAGSLYRVRSVFHPASLSRPNQGLPIRGVPTWHLWRIAWHAISRPKQNKQPLLSVVACWKQLSHGENDQILNRFGVFQTVSICKYYDFVDFVCIIDLTCCG